MDSKSWDDSARVHQHPRGHQVQQPEWVTCKEHDCGSLPWDCIYPPAQMVNWPCLSTSSDSGLPKAEILSSCCWIHSRIASLISDPWWSRLERKEVKVKQPGCSPPAQLLAAPQQDTSLLLLSKFLLSGTVFCVKEKKKILLQTWGTFTPTPFIFSSVLMSPSHWNIYCFDVNLHQEPGGIWQHFVSDRQHSLLLWSPFSEKQFFT